MTVIMYVKPNCSYCVKAAALLERKNISYTKVNIENDLILIEKVQKLSGRRTVPQIFINEVAIGGCDDLYELERQGILDKMLEGNN